MSQPLTVTMGVFRTMNPLSGNVHVVGGSRRHRGVRKRNSQAISKSQEIQAATDDESGMTAGRGATSASAPAAGRETGADAAREKAGEAVRTLTRKETEARGKKRGAAESSGGGGSDDRGTPKPKAAQWTPIIWTADGELQDPVELPNDEMTFVEAVHREVDLAGMAKWLLQAKDARVRQHVWDRLMDMAYGKNARAAKSPARTFINDLPRPMRD
jgi:hypothetical protein